MCVQLEQIHQRTVSIVDYHIFHLLIMPVSESACWETYGLDGLRLIKQSPIELAAQDAQSRLLS
jgi:hypothetical protein